MDAELKNYLVDFEERISDILYQQCHSLGLLLDARIPKSEDVTKWWNENAPYYMADAVREYNSYPTVVLAWACLLGMAVANNWDLDWEKYKSYQLKDFYGERGYDDMDENIMKKYLHIDPESPKGKKLYKTLESLANISNTLIRHEGIDSCTEKAFHALAKAIKSMFVLGAAIQLNNLGYKWVAIDSKTTNNFS